jgi:hypothetical protein
MNLWLLLALAGLLLAALLVVVLRRGQQQNTGIRPSSSRLDEVDTVIGWQPQVTRILSGPERQAHATLTRALPEYLVLAQVPLARFLRVPTRNSYGEWLNRVGTLSADLLVCDHTTQVIAVVEVRSPREGQRSRKRHQRKARVLQAAGVKVLEWAEGEVPTPSSVRALLLPESAAQPAVLRDAPSMMQSFGSTPLSAIPIGEAEETGPGELREPPPSTWFDDFESQPGASAPPPGGKR